MVRTEEAASATAAPARSSAGRSSRRARTRRTSTTSASSRTRTRSGLPGDGGFHSLTVERAAIPTAKGSTRARGPSGPSTGTSAVPVSRTARRPHGTGPGRGPSASASSTSTPNPTPSGQDPCTADHSQATASSDHRGRPSTRVPAHRCSDHAARTRPSSWGRSPHAADVATRAAVATTTAASGPAHRRAVAASSPARATSRSARTAWTPVTPATSSTTLVPICASHCVGTYGRSARAVSGSGSVPNHSPSRSDRPMRRCSHRSTSGAVRSRRRRPASTAQTPQAITRGVLALPFSRCCSGLVDISLASGRWVVVDEHVTADTRSRGAIGRTVDPAAPYGGRCSGPSVHAAPGPDLTAW